MSLFIYSIQIATGQLSTAISTACTDARTIHAISAECRQLWQRSTAIRHGPRHENKHATGEKRMKQHDLQLMKMKVSMCLKHMSDLHARTIQQI